MADIVLATLNAKYIHTAFGLRYLLANLGELAPRACLLEFDLHQRPIDIVEAILAQRPRVVGLGVYIWNATETRQVVALLKRVSPYLVIVLGGPEVSYETEEQAIVDLADHVVTGEADLAFADLCRQLVGGRPPPAKILAAPLPALDRLALPYSRYTDHDLAHRVVYVEASRGCPFTCEFCLSSLDIPVRQFPLDPFLGEMQQLLDRGLRQFKFVDRTFNLNLQVGTAILQFFLARLRPDLLLHVEMIPDRLPQQLREAIRRFPPGTLQFEIGIQTFNPDVATRIHRRQDHARTVDNLRFLRDETGVHLHVDLIVGLPGESLESFAAGFDQLVALRPHEIQVGILKRLRGTPIVRHDAEWEMVYSPETPYEILCNRLLDFPTLQRLRRFARYWDLVANSGSFLETTPLLWNQEPSPFASFMQWSDWAHAAIGRQHGIALDRLAELLFRHLTEVRRLAPGHVALRLQQDFARTGRGLPVFLRPHLQSTARPERGHPSARRGRKRQDRHLGGIIGLD